MADNIFLTDDEILALSMQHGKLWPIGLNTIAMTEDEVSRAVIRGLRSLIVRGIIDSDDDYGVPRERDLDEIARDIVEFIDSTRYIGAYMAPASNPEVVSGTSVTAAQTHDDWIVDTVTEVGIHILRRMPVHDATQIIVNISEQAFNGSYFGDLSNQPENVCVLRFGPAIENTITIKPGSAIGEVNGNPVDTWDRQLVFDAFRPV